jgi:hypothetical protein
VRYAADEGSGEEMLYSAPTLAAPRSPDEPRGDDAIIDAAPPIDENVRMVGSAPDVSDHDPMGTARPSDRASPTSSDEVAKTEIEIAEILVPAGVQSGDVFRVVLTDGRELTIACPDDAGPGDLLEIDLPPAEDGDLGMREPSSPELGGGDGETAEVVIPEGLQAGQSFTVESSWGGQFEVTVPRGTLPGSTLFVELPKAAEDDVETGETPATALLQLNV